MPAAIEHGAAHAPAAAPDFVLQGSSGPVSLHELRGKVVLVDFWASWCAPCRQSFPWMARMSEQYAARGLTIVAVNLDKKRDRADAFLNEYTPPFLVAFDPAGKTAEAFHVQAMPSSFLVSRTGEIVFAHEGFQTGKSETIEQQIKEALAK